MRIYQGEHSVQGMGIWGDAAFVLHDTGICSVYDLLTKCETPVDTIRLGSYNAGTPSRDYLNHANSCMFSETHYKNNPIPLLYVTIGTGIGADEDGYFYRCAVENITCNIDALGKEKYRAQTLQIISYRPEGIEKTPFIQPCWGCPAFLVDPQEQCLYIFSAKYRTKRDCIPTGQHNQYIITKFALPHIEDGDKIILTPQKIMEQFCVTSDVQFTQGGTIFNGKLYYTFGCPHAGYPLKILVFDLRKKRIFAEVSIPDDALNSEEIECCAAYRGKLMVNTSGIGHGSIFALNDDALLP